MRPLRAAPPAAEPCLSQSYSSRKRKGKKQKGGTIIESRVAELAEHERWLDEVLYRPVACPAPDCGHDKLHKHGLRTRTLLGELGERFASLVILIAVFRCPKCGATWRVLPAFVARCLHRSWRVIAKAVAKREPVEVPQPELVPERTRARWKARLRQAARLPLQALAVSGAQALRAVAQQLGLAASRQELVAVHRKALAPTCAFGSLAELLHRLMPGIRLV